MVSHVQAHYAELDQLLRSAAGVGPVASATLIVELPELGRPNRREIAASVDVTPMANESGNSEGRRRVQGERFEIRRVLYMATLTTARHPPSSRPSTTGYGAPTSCCPRCSWSPACASFSPRSTPWPKPITLGTNRFTALDSEDGYAEGQRG